MRLEFLLARARAHHDEGHEADLLVFLESIAHTPSAFSTNLQGDDDEIRQAQVGSFDHGSGMLEDARLGSALEKRDAKLLGKSKIAIQQENALAGK